MQREITIEQAAAAKAQPWPKDAPSQFIVLRRVLAGRPASARDLAGRFDGAPRGRKMAEMLKTLVALGQARDIGDGRYLA